MGVLVDPHFFTPADHLFFHDHYNPDLGMSVTSRARGTRRQRITRGMED